MGAYRQRTLKQPVEFAGVGLHSGQQCTATVRPADEHCGIVFRRLDLKARDCVVMARPENVAATNHGTAIVNDAGVTVSTIEHLMAGLALCGVDNAEIDLFGPEAPILDGSAAVFVEGFEDAGLMAQAAPRAGFVVEEPLAVHDGGDRLIEVSPFEGRSVDVAIDFGDCMIGNQSLVLDLDVAEDRARLARARTFCRLYEIEALRRMGLIRGGSLENSLVVDGDRILNDETLRDPEEFALHKALDLIGDLYLLGAPLIGAVRAIRPGHDLNVRMAQALRDRRAREEAAPAAIFATA